MRHLTIFVCIVLCVAARAASQDSHYIIKVTPTLVYLDTGTRDGAVAGQIYVIVEGSAEDAVVDVNLRDRALIGQVRIIRVAEEFCIAELVHRVEGKHFSVLQKAVALKTWEQLKVSLVHGSDPSQAKSSRSFAILVGGDWNKETSIRAWPDSLLPVMDSVGGLGIALRLGQIWSDHWRVNLTYRVSGELLGTGDVGQLSFEGDLQYLVRGAGATIVYLGIGLGMHQLNWGVPYNVTADDSANKIGTNIIAGMVLPLGRGEWNVVCEGGYQSVVAWGRRIDASHTRTYVGLERQF